MGAATAAQVRRLAMDYLARREHGYTELLDKLKARGVPLPLAKEQLQKLADEGLQSDGRFSDMYTRAQAARGKGPLYIRNGLSKHGLASVEISAALNRCEVDWAVSAIQVANKKYPDGCCDQNERAKAMRFLQQRGFTSEQASTALRSVKR